MILNDPQDVSSIEQVTYNEPIPEVEQDTGDVVKAFLEENHAAYNFADYLSSKLTREDYPVDPTFSADEHLVGMEGYSERLLRAKSMPEFNSIRAKIEEENYNNELYAKGSGTQKLLGLGALIATDPVMLIGGTVSLLSKARAASKGIMAAETIAKSGMGATAAQYGVKTAAVVGAEEAALQLNSETRTGLTSMVNVATAGIIGGALGAYVGRVSKAEVDNIGAKLADELNTAMDAEDLMAAYKMRKGAGSEQVDQLDDLSIVNLDIATKAYSKLPTFLQSPIVFLGSSPSRIVRMFNEQIADLNLIRKGNVKGDATVLSVEAIKKSVSEYDYATSDAIDTLFSSYKKRVRAEGGSPISRKQFAIEISHAGNRNDEHIIPEVGQAAKDIRKKVIEPVGSFARESKLMEKEAGAEVLGAESYWPRSYLTDKVRAKQNEFIDIAIEDITQKAEAKAVASAEFKSLDDEYRLVRKQNKSLYAKQQRATLSAEKLAEREEELSWLNKFAYKRSVKKSQPIEEFLNDVEVKGASIETNLSSLDDLVESVRIERGEVEGLSDIEINMDRISRSIAELHSEAKLNDVADAASELEDAVAKVTSDFNKLLMRMGTDADEIRQTEEFAALSAMQNEAMALTKGTKPFKEELLKLRARAKEEGGVYQDAIRKRANSINSQRSGKEYKAEDFTSALERNAMHMKDVEERMRSRLSAYKGDSASDVKGFIQRGEYAPKLTRKVLNATRRIARARKMDASDIRQRAYELTDRIISTVPGRLPYEGGAGSRGGFVKRNLTRGSAKARVWDIDYEKIKDFVMTDPEALMHQMSNTMVTDSAIMRNFETLDFKELDKQIELDYVQMRDKGVMQKDGTSRPWTNEELKTLSDRMTTERSMFKGVFERVRGTYAMPDDYNSFAHIGERALLGINYVTKLGGVTISSLTDAARIPMVKGLTKSYGKLIKAAALDMEGLKASIEDMKLLGVASDATLKMMQRMDMNEFTPAMNMVDKGIQESTKIMTILSGIGIWNAGLRTMSGVIVQDEMLRAISTFAKTGKLDKAAQTSLAANFIDEGMMLRIHAQFKKYGEGKHALASNSNLWDDTEAAMYFKAAIRKQIEEIIVTPGQHKPLWTSRPGWRLISQFKGYAFASNVKVCMAGLQAGDARALSGATAMVMLGSTTYMIKQKLAGREISKDPAVLVMEGFDRSGVTGILFDVNNMTEKLTGGVVGLHRIAGGKPMSRYASQNAVGTVLGPSFGLMQNLFTTTGAAAKGEWSKGDIHAARALVPFNNVFWLSKAFDSLENTARE